MAEFTGRVGAGVGVIHGMEDTLSWDRPHSSFYPDSKRLRRSDLGVDVLSLDLAAGYAFGSPEDTVRLITDLNLSTAFVNAKAGIFANSRAMLEAGPAFKYMQVLFGYGVADLPDEGAKAMAQLRLNIPLSHGDASSYVGAAGAAALDSTFPLELDDRGYFTLGAYYGLRWGGASGQVNSQE